MLIHWLYQQGGNAPKEKIDTMADMQNTDNPMSIVIMHAALAAFVSIGSAALLAMTVFGPNPTLRFSGLVFGLGFSFVAYKLWVYRARR